MHGELLYMKVEDEGSEGRVRCRPRLGCMDGVKQALGSRGITLEAARQCEKDRKEWRALLDMYKWFLCSFEPSSRALVAYHLERGGMPLYDAV